MARPAVPLSIRGKRRTGGPGIQETLSLEARIARLQGNLADFVDRVRAAP